MTTLHTEIVIDAPVEKVWELLWDDKSYREWTKYFSPGSNYKSDWQVGGKTFFLDESQENGMVSTIEELEEPVRVIFKHLGMLENGKEIMFSKELSVWTGSLEKYFLEPLGDKTKLSCDVQTSNEYEKEHQEGFEKGFNWIKQAAEKGN